MLKLTLDPSPNSKQSLSVCLWNLNSEAVRNRGEPSLLKAYITICDFYIIFSSET